jgi:hypothetical protein
VTISAHDLNHDAGLFHRTYPNWPHAEPEPPCAPTLYLVQVPGRADALLDPAALAAFLASGARPGGLYDVSVCSRKTPLVLARVTGFWQVLLPGEAGVTDPVALAEFEISSDEESR